MKEAKPATESRNTVVHILMSRPQPLDLEENTIFPFRRQDSKIC